MAWEFITHFFEQALERGSRSSVVTMLVIVMGMLLAGLVFSANTVAPWVSMLLSGMLGVTFLFFLFWYSFFALKSPDALRSERFSIQKMAIERGMLGDSVSGVVSESDVSNIISRSESSHPLIEGDPS